ncbi:hypothetical protein [Paraburkholderia sp.]|uniref:hypothetical protein n=1 Tax=Paraburkholderia sp. TaxID=1926495 RepID=UPI0025D6C892|nr:hypothetical protein [Paraburkholderia sp.]
MKQDLPLHIVFSDTAKSMISSAMGSGYLRGECIIVDGIFHLGFLKNRNCADLSAWFVERFQQPSRECFTPALSKPHTCGIGGACDCIVWVDASNVAEYCNFLSWNYVSEYHDFRLIFVDQLEKMERVEFIRRIEDIANNAASSDELDVDGFHREWERLIRENGEFRLFNHVRRIESYIESDFHQHLLGRIGHDWVPSSQVVAEILSDSIVSGREVPGDLFFYCLIDKFCDLKILERADDPDARMGMIRRV